MKKVKAYSRLTSIRISRLVFILCWIAYATAYVGRISYYTALASMIKDSGFAKSDAGLIGTAFFFFYGCGQLVSGFFGDRVSPFKMILTGLTFSAAANLCMSFYHSYHISMVVLWGLNGFAQSMIWSPILYIFIHIMHTVLQNKAYLYITTAIPAGTVATYLLSMIILKFSNWNLIFIVGSVLMFLAAILWLYGSLRAFPYFAPKDGPHGAEKAKEKPAGGVSQNFMQLMLLSGAGIMLFAILIHGMLKEGVSVWVPTMISDTYHVSSSFSVFLSMFLPLVGLCGPYVISFFYNRRLKQDEVTAAALCLVAAVPPLCVLLLIQKLPLVVSVAMLALITSAMNAFNYITVTMIPVRFAPYHRASTATGLLNSITYIGCAVSTYGFGFLSEQFGWGNTILFWVGLDFMGILVCSLSFHRWRKFIHLQKPKKDGVF